MNKNGAFLTKNTISNQNGRFCITNSIMACMTVLMSNMLGRKRSILEKNDQKRPKTDENEHK